MLTYKKVNKILEERGYNYTLHPGNGYIYFWPSADDTSQLYDGSICVNRLNHTTIEWILDDLKDKIKETNLKSCRDINEFGQFLS